ncbi:MAG: DUF4340 domain-containing protein, partial [Verrucomicrobia bacterium]|nr:DUF4340 domain-containing protein [Verrucomicrobiota bacterium]
LADLKIDSFLPDARAADPAALGLAEPRGTLTFSTTENPPRVVEVQLGKAVEPEKDNAPAPAASPSTTPLPSRVTAPNTVYARIAGRPSVVTLPKTVEDYLNLKPAELRDRQLLRIANADLVNRIRITPAAGPELTLTRAKSPEETGDPAGAEGGKPEKPWNLRVAGANADAPANGAEAERLLTRLPAQTVKDFVADTASDLAKYGLDKPTLRVAFLSHSSENTAEAGAGEVPLSTLVFGKVEGDLVYARLEEEPFIVSVDKAILDTVPTDPIAWQPLPIFKFDPKELRTATQTVPGRPETAFERTPESAPLAWKLAGNNAAGAGTLDVVKAQSLVNTLARLRATRWVGPEKPEYKLAADTPEGVATITFQTDPKPPANAAAGGGKLFIGQRSPDGMWYARVEGKPGVFLLSEPDHATLLAPLTSAPPPAATTTALPSPAPGAAATATPSLAPSAAAAAATPTASP